MAYSILVSLERNIDQILSDNRFSIAPDERKQITSLDKSVISIRAFLEEFPVKSKNLEARIRNVAAEGEDIIEWFVLEQIHSLPVAQSNWMETLRRMKFRCQLHKVSTEMESIAGVVAEIKSKITAKATHLSDSPGTGSPSQVADREKTNMVDLNEDLIEIKARLCGETPQLQVLPIYGMGGIGKTTLARNAYYDKLIMEHFQILAWVTISQDYSPRRILLQLLDSLKEFNSQNISDLTNIEMSAKVHKILFGRRFLIVMDDVWNPKVLDDVRKFLPNDKNGSRIMLTTRLTGVATYANSSIPSHEMRLMDEDQSWNLLRQKVHIPRELESTGREIARSCCGLPLAITVIAGVLSRVSKILPSWDEIAKNVKQSLSTADGQIEKILSLSYNHLPQHLRPCFLYMGGFPEDHEIKVTYLARLWIAEGFVKPVESKRFEDSAEEYLEDLVHRSLIIIKKRKPNGRIKSCSLHDMVREMCISLSLEEKFLVHVKDRRGLLESIRRRHRRISFNIADDADFYSLANFSSSIVRTILFFPDGYHFHPFGSFRLLKVLDVIRVKINSQFLPDQLFELFHLRYLAFPCFQSIPKRIAHLQNLQTLIIDGLHVTTLPAEIFNMPELRHLICHGHTLFSLLVGAISALENLQTLRVCSLECSIRILNLVPNLKKLSLTYSLVTRDYEVLFHNLVHLGLLEDLQLELTSGGSKDLLPNLVAPFSLKKLTLIGWGLWDVYLNFAGPFPNLEVLKLKNFNFMKREWRSSDEEFPQLKYLLVENSNLSRWGVEESSHFPRLKTLVIRRCWSLSQIPDGIRDVQTLELIELKGCRKSLADYAKLIEEEARDYGNDEFQVRCSDY